MIKSTKALFLPFIFFVFFINCQQKSSDSLNGRKRINFNANWNFTKNNATSPDKLDTNGSGWRKLDLPHDWAIEGPFSKEVYFQGGSLPYPGVGWYRKTFDLDITGKKALLEFDGVMKDAEVWINGKALGGWGFGYTSFALDITDYLKPTGNVIDVRVENVDYSSRWYPGSGIYRNVWLTITNPVHVAHWGTFVTTPKVESDRATVRIQTELANEGKKLTEITLESKILNSEGTLVGSTSTQVEITAGVKSTLNQNIEIESPELWDIEDPNMYTVNTLVRVKGKIVDNYSTPFGIRTFRFDANEGFVLNGRQVKIQGVNMHHDLGPLGAAVNYRATERQLEIMKDMGVNAIRTAHNPPSPEQMDLCDKMGILVMDESFDEWRKSKLNVRESYSVYFDEWAKKDMAALVRRDRNHPSVILWSTGNEVPELGTGKVRISAEGEDAVDEVHYVQDGQLVTINGWEAEDKVYARYDGDKFSRADVSNAKKLANMEAASLSGSEWKVGGFYNNKKVYHFDFWDDEDGKNSARMLTKVCHDLDPTRPVSSGIHLSVRLDQEVMDAFDVAGFNYWHKEIEDLHVEYPNKPLLVTEAAAMLSTRGEYFFPAERIYCGFSHDSKQLSSYDLTNTCFGTLPDVEFKLQDDNPWLAGQFVWSGFDYHGEPDPYEDSWPAHSSYFGIVDMAGFEKDRFYLYQSQWTEEPMIHLLPHWTWPGREGETTPVYIYSNCPEVELFVNGVSRGKKRQQEGVYRFKWEDVKYEPGSIGAVGYDDEGNTIAQKQIKTAGEAKKIVLQADRASINSDGTDLSFIKATVVDSEGNICPDASNLIEFQINGTGTLAAVGNGDPTSLESYQEPKRSAFHGKCLLIVKAGNKKGEINITASSPGLESSDIKVLTK